MMMYEVNVMTAQVEYVNKFFGFIETLNEVMEIAACDNVEAIDVVCCETGEVLVQVESGNLTYVATEAMERFDREVMLLC